jgi:hypothetical protein
MAGLRRRAPTSRPRCWLTERSPLAGHNLPEYTSLVQESAQSTHAEAHRHTHGKPHSPPPPPPPPPPRGGGGPPPPGNNGGAARGPHPRATTHPPPRAATPPPPPPPAAHVDERGALPRVELAGGGEQRLPRAALVQPQRAQHGHRLLQQPPVDCFAGSLRFHKQQQAVQGALVQLRAAGTEAEAQSWAGICRPQGREGAQAGDGLAEGSCGVASFAASRMSRATARASHAHVHHSATC